MVTGLTPPMGTPLDSLKALSHVCSLPQKDDRGRSSKNSLRAWPGRLLYLWPHMLGNPLVPFTINQTKSSRLVILEKHHCHHKGEGDTQGRGPETIRALASPPSPNLEALFFAAFRPEFDVHQEMVIFLIADLTIARGIWLHSLPCFPLKSKETQELGTKDQLKPEPRYPKINIVNLAL